LIQETLDPQANKPCTIETLGEHTSAFCHGQDEFAELLNNKRLQLEFSKQSLTYVIFG